MSEKSEKSEKKSLLRSYWYTRKKTTLSRIKLLNSNLSNELENSIIYDIISDPEELKKFKRNLEFNMKK